MTDFAGYGATSDPAGQPQPSSGLPPANWYPSPATPGYEQWWDGTGWTEHTRPATALFPPPTAATYPGAYGFAGEPITYARAPKSRVAAGLLALFLGGLGIHNFYLGFTSKGLTQLLVMLFAGWLILPAIAIGIWALVECIMIFARSINYDAFGVPLAE